MYDMDCLMRIPTNRPGFTLVETMLFFGIFAIMSGTIIAVLVATQEARIRQQYVSEVEQRGALLLSTITRSVRRSEGVIAPLATKSGAILTLQMAGNAEYPTIFTRTSTGRILLVQKTDVYPLIDDRASATTFNVRNVGGNNLIVSFDLRTVIPTVPAQTYVRHFESTITLFPDDRLEGGGCGTCAAPTCVNNVYQWYHCLSDVCTLSTNTIAC